MGSSKTTKWIIIAVVAAVVAALTTVAFQMVRARAKKKAAWYDEEPDFGYDFEADDADAIAAE